MSIALMDFSREGGLPICKDALLRVLSTCDIKSKPSFFCFWRGLMLTGPTVVPSKDESSCFCWAPSWHLPGMPTFHILPFFFAWQDWRRRQKEVRSILATGEGLSDRLWHLNGYQPWNREPQPLQEDTPGDVQLWGNCTNPSAMGHRVSYCSSLSQQFHSVVAHNLSSSSFQPSLAGTSRMENWTTQDYLNRFLQQKQSWCLLISGHKLSNSPLVWLRNSVSQLW